MKFDLNSKQEGRRHRSPMWLLQDIKAHYGLSDKRLASLRKQSTPVAFPEPAFIAKARLGQRVYYSRADIHKWMAALRNDLICRIISIQEEIDAIDRGLRDNI